MDDEYVFQNLDLAMIDIGATLFVEQIDVAKGELWMEKHECEVPAHAEKSTRAQMVLLLITDADGQTHTLVFHPRSNVAMDIISGDFAQRVKLVAKTC